MVHRNVLSENARFRTSKAISDLKRTWRHFTNDDPLLAETTTARQRAAAGRRKVQLKMAPDVSVAEFAETVQGERENFIPVSFLKVGAGVSRAVARVVVNSTGELGTGFMCAPGLFITNLHVLQSPADAISATVEFDFLEEDGVEPTKFRLNPEECFVYDDVASRDFVIAAIGNRISGPKPHKAFGWCPLSDASNKHSIGEFANIIQHPDGRPKQVVLQDNLIAARSDFALHYLADTEGGSSGSPVFNNAWQVIALHHWGAALHEMGDAFEGMEPAHNYDPRSVNEGIRISQIVTFIRERLASLPAHERPLMEELIDFGFKVPPAEAMRDQHTQVSTGSVGASAGRKDITSSTGGCTATWTIPIEVSVSIPGHQMHGSPAIEPEETENTRRQTAMSFSSAETALPLEGEGYRPDFLDDHIVELPRLLSSRQPDIAPLKKPEDHPGAKLGELQFTHFSVVVNRRRKLPFFGACNVDGKTLFGINSDLKDYKYADTDEKTFASKAEGGHYWRHDHRIQKSDQTVNEWYTGTNVLVPRDGTDDAEIYKAVADFDRGHIVRRTEPIWGDLASGRAANRQSFNFANAAPQTPTFNQSKTRDEGRIDEGEEKRSWYGMEVAVLRAATNEDAKMNVFTGPIFDEDDPVYGPGRVGGGNRKIPLKYWKIAVWQRGDDLRSIAVAYSQRFSLVKPEEGGAESLDEPEELLLLRDFLTTVAHIENVN